MPDTTNLPPCRSADNTTMFPNGGSGSSLTLRNINSTTGMMAATAMTCSAQRASGWLRRHHGYSLSPRYPAGEGDVLVSDDVVFTQGALDAFLAGPATGRSVKAVGSASEASQAE